MGVVAKIISLDKLYQDYCNNHSNPIIVNRHNLKTKEDKNEFNNLLATQYSGETISTIPSCSCKKYEHEIFKHHVCEICGVEVLSSTKRPIDMAAWIGLPEGVNAFINPTVLIQLSNIFSNKTFDVMRYLLDEDYRVPSVEKRSEVVNKVIALRLPRGINRFYADWENILESLFCSKATTSCTTRNMPARMNYLRKLNSEGKLFCKWLPLASKSMFITESSLNIDGRYSDEVMLSGLEAATMIAGINNSSTRYSIRKVRNIAARANLSLADYHLTNWSTRWAGSKDSGSMLRKHIYSTRTDWSMRLVLTADQRLNIRYDECSIPWGAALVAFGTHVANKLLTRGYTERMVNRIIESSYATSTNKWGPLLKRIFKELLKECDYGDGYGIPCIFLRNPSLTRGSSVIYRITEIKEDARDKTASFNILQFYAANADVDGDTVTITPILDKFMYEHAKMLEGKYYVLDLNRTLSVSPYVKLPGEAKSTIGHWIESDY